MSNRWDYEPSAYGVGGEPSWMQQLTFYTTLCDLVCKRGDTKTSKHWDVSHIIVRGNSQKAMTDLNNQIKSICIKYYLNDVHTLFDNTKYLDEFIVFYPADY